MLTTVSTACGPHFGVFCRITESTKMIWKRIFTFRNSNFSPWNGLLLASAIGNHFLFSSLVWNLRSEKWTLHTSAVCTSQHSPLLLSAVEMGLSFHISVVNDMLNYLTIWNKNKQNEQIIYYALHTDIQKKRKSSSLKEQKLPLCT